jgi:hypothetical protein
VNALSCLIEQAPAPSLQSSRSQASNNTFAAPPADVEPTGVIDMDAFESGAEDWLLPGMDSSSLEWEPSLENMTALLP